MNSEELTIKEAQQKVKEFALRNNWIDNPNLDKIDHLHEELVEISQHLRYKSKEEMAEFVKENSERPIISTELASIVVLFQTVFFT